MTRLAARADNSRSTERMDGEYVKIAIRRHNVVQPEGRLIEPTRSTAMDNLECVSLRRIVSAKNGHCSACIVRPEE